MRDIKHDMITYALGAHAHASVELQILARGRHM